MLSLLPSRRRGRPSSRPNLVACTFTGLVGALALLTTITTSAADPPLTLAEAQRLAVARSRQLSAQDSAVVAAREMAVAAGQRPDPILKLGLDSWPVNGPNQFSFGGDDFTMGRIAVSQELTRADKRGLRAQRYAGEGEKTLAEKTAMVAEIQRETALAWIDRYYAEAMSAIIAEQTKTLELEIVASEGAYRGGRGNQADVIAIHSALLDLEDRASEITRRIRTATTSLARWVGEAAAVPLAGKPEMDSLLLDQRTLETEILHHPEVAVLTKQEELASTDVKLAEANKRADWNVELAYAQRGAAFSDFVSVSVSIPLQWDQKNRQDRDVAAKLALAAQAVAEREEAVRAHVGEVLAQMQEWENGRERMARYARKILPLAQARTRAVLAAYSGGTATSTDLLLAGRDEIAVRLRALELEMEIARLWARLNFLFPGNLTSNGQALADYRTFSEGSK